MLKGVAYQHNVQVVETSGEAAHYLQMFKNEKGGCLSSQWSNKNYSRQRSRGCYLPRCTMQRQLWLVITQVETEHVN